MRKSALVSPNISTHLFEQTHEWMPLSSPVLILTCWNSTWGRGADCRLFRIYRNFLCKHSEMNSNVALSLGYLNNLLPPHLPHVIITIRWKRQEHWLRYSLRLAIILSAFEQMGSDAWKQMESVQFISSLLCLHFLIAASLVMTISSLLIFVLFFHCFKRKANFCPPLKKCPFPPPPLVQI